MTADEMSWTMDEFNGCRRWRMDRDQSVDISMLPGKWSAVARRWDARPCSVDVASFCETSDSGICLQGFTPFISSPWNTGITQKLTPLFAANCMLFQNTPSLFKDNVMIVLCVHTQPHLCPYLLQLSICLLRTGPMFNVLPTKKENTAHCTSAVRSISMSMSHSSTIPDSHGRSPACWCVWNCDRLKIHSKQVSKIVWHFKSNSCNAPLSLANKCVFSNQHSRYKQVINITCQTTLKYVHHTGQAGILHTHTHTQIQPHFLIGLTWHWCPKQPSTKTPWNTTVFRCFYEAVYCICCYVFC